MPFAVVCHEMPYRFMVLVVMSYRQCRDVFCFLHKYAVCVMVDEYLYIVNFTRIEYLRTEVHPDANTRVLSTLLKCLSVSCLQDFVKSHRPYGAAIEPISPPDMHHIMP